MPVGYEVGFFVKQNKSKSMSKELNAQINNLYDEPLNFEELNEASSNLIEFFTLLIEEDQEEQKRKEKKNENTKCIKRGSKTIDEKNLQRNLKSEN